MSKGIKVVLSAANMGDVDELDFDIWAKFVTENIDEKTGIEVAEVEQFRFGEPGGDLITGATEEQNDRLSTWIRVDGWELFCGETWNTMRAEAEAQTASA